MESRNSRRKIEAAERRRQCYELRLRGKRVDEIARELGCSMAAVSTHLTKYREELDAASREDAATIRKLEIERLDHYIDKLSPKIEEGNEKAIQTALQAQQRRAKLLGLDAQVTSQLVVTNQPSDIEAIKAQLLAEINGEAGR